MNDVADVIERARERARTLLGETTRSGARVAVETIGLDFLGHFEKNGLRDRANERGLAWVGLDRITDWLVACVCVREREACVGRGKENTGECQLQA